jgi:hypothetical protein
MASPEPRKLDAFEKKAMLQQDFMISFQPPLPCEVIDCLNTATVGRVKYNKENNSWQMLVRCLPCTEKIAKMYIDPE